MERVWDTNFYQHTISLPSHDSTITFRSCCKDRLTLLCIVVLLCCDVIYWWLYCIVSSPILWRFILISLSALLTFLFYGSFLLCFLPVHSDTTNSWETTQHFPRLIVACLSQIFTIYLQQWSNVNICYKKTKNQNKVIRLMATNATAYNKNLSAANPWLWKVHIKTSQIEIIEYVLWTLWMYWIVWLLLSPNTQKD